MSAAGIAIRVRFVKTDRTDLVCVACGNFRTDFAIVRNDGSAAQSGLHRKCRDAVKVGRKKVAPVATAEAT